MKLTIKMNFLFNGNSLDKQINYHGKKIGDIILSFISWLALGRYNWILFQLTLAVMRHYQLKKVADIFCNSKAPYCFLLIKIEKRTTVKVYYNNCNYTRGIDNIYAQALCLFSFRRRGFRDNIFRM